MWPHGYPIYYYIDLKLYYFKSRFYFSPLLANALETTKDLHVEKRKNTRHFYFS